MTASASPRPQKTRSRTLHAEQLDIWNEDQLIHLYSSPHIPKSEMKRLIECVRSLQSIWTLIIADLSRLRPPKPGDQLSFPDVEEWDRAASRYDAERRVVLLSSLAANFLKGRPRTRRRALEALSMPEMLEGDQIAQLQTENSNHSLMTVFGSSRRWRAKMSVLSDAGINTIGELCQLSPLEFQQAGFSDDDLRSLDRCLVPFGLGVVFRYHLTPESKETFTKSTIAMP